MDYYLDMVKSIDLKKASEIDGDVWERHTTKEEKERIAQMLQYEYGDKVLEIGPGTGFLAVYICKTKPNIKSYTGVEIIETFKSQCESLAEANGVNNACFVQGNGCKMADFKDRSFDTCIMAEVLEHVQNPIEVLKEAYRVLKKGANVIITVPSKGLMPPDKVPGHLQDFTVDDMKALIHIAKFKLLHHRQFAAWEFYLAIK